jgi:DNA polymerase V
MSLIGLVDCNNFFVSCERVFNPKIRNKPAIVLSSNDGCVIARSQEVKDLGVEMGVPIFKINNLIKKHKIHLNSTNFILYRDMSKRVMNIIKELVDDVEVYSVDEAFIDLKSIDDPVKFCTNLRAIIQQFVGIPVSVGISNNKTLAKLANRIAKKDTGVFVIDHTNRTKILKETKVQDIWGIGRRISAKLNQYQIYSAHDLHNKNNDWIKKQLTIKGLETVEELRGKEAFKLETQAQPRKSIISSRTFSKKIRNREEIEKAISNHVENVARQLREEQSAAKSLTVYISTGFFQKGPIYHKHAKLDFDHYSDDVFYLLQKSKEAISQIYKENISFKKAGVIISDIIPKDRTYVSNLFGENLDSKSKINQIIDVINKKFGDNTIKMSSSGVDYGWKPKSDFRSKNFTTSWEDILKIG